MALGKAALIDLYRRRAPRYDWSAQLYHLIGFREWAYRKKAVCALGLQPGYTVVEVGCGTGLNFSLLRDEVGATGLIVGVDMTDSMLARARDRVETQKSLLPVLLPLFRPFGVSLDLAERHPWESLREHFDRFGLEEHYFGFAYVAWGEK